MKSCVIFIIAFISSNMAIGCDEVLLKRYSEYKEYVIDSDKNMPDIWSYLYKNGFDKTSYSKNYPGLYSQIKIDESDIINIDEYQGSCKNNRGYLMIRIKDRDRRFNLYVITFKLVNDRWMISALSKEPGGLDIEKYVAEKLMGIPVKFKKVTKI